MGFTGPGVWHGLAGFHLIHDEEEDALPLPRSERDIPLMICDRSFTVDGAFAYPGLDPSLAVTPGVSGPYMNGVLGDVILVNGAPWPVDIAPAERFDLVIDFARYPAGTRVRLVNRLGAGPTAEVMRFDVSPVAPQGRRCCRCG